ncbi:hypothetical protein [Dyadobacter aurulentus]|uniref:hypothetical protein n=1 Tax=Dyadobacter sp. UC 10 TaxID=2605428 RepID=UPI0011F0D138|nr:hypothetical protein [Dyadobacter sp. UC 10]KAA0990110.1 hypothetical protein FXO21_08025 [Dyadobacter sp. UC 10]
MKGSLLVVLLAFIIQSCVDCGPQRELSVEIRFMEDSLGIDSIFAVNALDNQIFQNEAENLTEMYRSVTLPISMHADSTTFVFVSRAKRDSFTVSTTACSDTKVIADLLSMQASRRRVRNPEALIRK